MILRVLLLLLTFLLPAGATRLGFLPFSNLTKYKGNWFLDKDVPAYLEKTLGKTYNVAPTDSIYRYLKDSKLPLYPNLPEQKRQAAKHFSADFLVSGDIVNFLVSKRIMGEGKYVVFLMLWSSFLFIHFQRKMT